MKKNIVRVAATIEIGSSSAKMHIAQWSRGKLSLLDRLEKPLSIGHEVFTTGRIRFETLRRLSDILAGFCTAAAEYGADKPRVVATTALREAGNRAHVLDHLRIQNGLEVDVLEEGEANAYYYDAMLRRLSDPQPRMLLSYIGTGSIGIAARQDKHFILSQNLHTGLLKLGDVLRVVMEHTTRIDQAAEEYLKTQLARVGLLLDAAGEFDSVVIGGRGSAPLAAMCSARVEKGVTLIERKALESFYATHSRMTPDQLAERYDLGGEQGELLYSTMMLYMALVRMTNVRRIYCPQAELPDALLALQLKPGARRAYEENLRASAKASALTLAGRYQCDLPHAKWVADTALLLFDKLRKVHGLSTRQSMLLAAACLLHESGYYANTRDSTAASFDLVRSAAIYGMRSQDAHLAAHIIAARNSPASEDWADRYYALPEEHSLFVAKMHILMRLADALDYSHKQKAKLTDVQIEQNRLVLHLRVRDHYALEEWAFEKCAELFEDVFGMEPELSIEYDRMEGGKA